jgi:NADH-quinone oxidoreductase subunit C
MSGVQTLLDTLQTCFGDKIAHSHIALDELTLEIAPEHLRDVCLTLRDETEFQFKQLIDVCGVDYLHYGTAEWQTEQTTKTGFSRATDPSKSQRIAAWGKPRFAVVYHLLSLTHNHRVRLRVFPSSEHLNVPSIVDIWPAANWFEREAFDLFGIIFDGHPDLRRILTDYGFIGHPFRKDFPLIGEVEMRYDAEQQRCIYEPVGIQPRTLIPKVIRTDARYTPVG